MEIYIGYCAAFLTTFAFLPQAIRVITYKKTEDISRNMYIMLVLGITFWLTYGILKKDLPIILSNSVTLAFSCIILYYKLTEERRNRSLS
jgi:MtN3 and saliva related transmembrane protein